MQVFYCLQSRGEGQGMQGKNMLLYLSKWHQQIKIEKNKAKEKLMRDEREKNIFKMKEKGKLNHMKDSRYWRMKGTKINK